MPALTAPQFTNEQAAKYHARETSITFRKLDVVDEGTFHQGNELEIPLFKLLNEGNQCAALIQLMNPLSHRLLDKIVGKDIPQ